MSINVSSFLYGVNYMNNDSLFDFVAECSIPFLLSEIWSQINSNNTAVSKQYLCLLEPLFTLKKTVCRRVVY